MPHNDALLQIPVRVVHRCAGLQKHLPQRCVRHGRVVPRGGKLRCQRTVRVLVIRQPDVHMPGQRPDGVHRLIPTRVVDDGQGKALRPRGIQRGSDPRQILRCRDEVYVFRPVVLQIHKNLGQPLHRNRLADLALTDRVILAIAAFQRAAAEKHRAAPGFGVRVAAQARLLPVVQGGAGHAQGVVCPAKAALPCGAVRPAGPGAKGAVMGYLHDKMPLSQNFLLLVYHKRRKCGILYLPILQNKGECFHVYPS